VRLLTRISTGITPRRESSWDEDARSFSIVSRVGCILSSVHAGDIGDMVSGDSTSARLLLEALVIAALAPASRLYLPVNPVQRRKAHSDDSGVTGL